MKNKTQFSAIAFLPIYTPGHKGHEKKLIMRVLETTGEEITHHIICLCAIEGIDEFFKKVITWGNSKDVYNIEDFNISKGVDDENDYIG